MRKRTVTAIGAGLIFAALIAASANIAVAPSAHADLDAGSCQSSYLSRFDGYIIPEADSQGLPYEGVKAFIDLQRGPICDTPSGTDEADNFMYAFVMLTDGGNPAPNPRRYIQVGYMRWDNSCTRWTSEYLNSTNPNSFIRTVDFADGCRTLSGNDGFSVRWVSNKNQMVTIHNGNTTVLDHTPFNIYNIWTQPFHTQYTAETKYVQTDVPGTHQDQTYFRQIQQQKYDDSWTSNLPSHVQDACPWPTRYQKSTFDLTQNLFIVETETGAGC